MECSLLSHKSFQIIENYDVKKSPSSVTPHPTRLFPFFLSNKRFRRVLKTTEAGPYLLISDPIMPDVTLFTENTGYHFIYLLFTPFDLDIKKEDHEVTTTKVLSFTE